MSADPGMRSRSTEAEGSGGRVILTAHGTHDARGKAEVQALAAAVDRRLAGWRVDLAWLSLVEPSLAEVASRGPAVVVPLLLGTGYHVLTDIPGVLEEHAPGSLVTAHLGPDTGLVSALVSRMKECGPRPSGVVLAAAGSSHPVARSQARQTADSLAAALGVPVGVGYLSGPGPDVGTALARMREVVPGRLAVATYLLASGAFSRRADEVARRFGVPASAPLAAHPAVVDVIVRRVTEASTGRARGGPLVLSP